jgi:hypothetical protein
VSSALLQVRDPNIEKRERTLESGQQHHYVPLFFIGGAGENPAPTVKVWMGEEFMFYLLCATSFR